MPHRTPLSSASKTDETHQPYFLAINSKPYKELHLSWRGGPVFSKLTSVERFENPVFQFESEVTKS
jgi:hypothetical protein